MRHDATIRCPNCKAPDCRKSKWLSTSERHDHRNTHPYRCRACAHRFHVRDRLPVRQGAAVFLSLLSLAIVLAATATLLLWNFEDPVAIESSAEPALVDPYTLRAAQEGDPPAQFRIARILLSGPMPDRKNASEAVRWLQSAAENHHTGAMVELGRLYRSGVGVLQNFGDAAKWIETAAVLGDPEGMHELGRLYRDGVGFERDIVQAYVWFNRSAAALNADAARDRDDVARGLSDVQLKEAQRKSMIAKKAPADDGAGTPRQAGAIKLSSTEKAEKDGAAD